MWLYLIVDDDLDTSLLNNEIRGCFVFLFENEVIWVLTVEHFLHDKLEFIISKCVEHVMIPQTAQNEIFIAFCHCLINFRYVLIDKVIDVFSHTDFLHWLFHNTLFLFNCGFIRSDSVWSTCFSGSIIVIIRIWCCLRCSVLSIRLLFVIVLLKLLLCLHCVEIVLWIFDNEEIRNIVA